MYRRHNLNIVIFSDEPKLENEIRSLSPNQYFTHDIEAYNYFNAEALENADIAIVNLALPCEFKDLRALCKRPDCRIIVCLMPEAEAHLSQEELDQVDDIWLRPLQKARIQLRMRHLLNELKRDEDARQHLIWLDTLIDSMPDLVWFKDLEGVHKKVNSKFCEFVKKSRDSVIGNTHAVIWNAPEDDDSCKASEDAAISSGKTIRTDEIVKIGDTKHLFKTYKTALKGPNGEIIGTCGFGHDMTNLLNLDMELNFFIDVMPIALALCDENDTIKQVNNRLLEYFNVQKEEILGKCLSDWQNSQLTKEISPVNDEEYYRYMPPGKPTRYLTVTRKDIKDIFGKKVGSVNIYRDITPNKELESRIWRAANTDTLTGLANRHAFDVYFRKLPSDAKINLCYIDLDEFKSVNDRFGHEAGDDALRIVAKSLRNVFAQDFPARLGGDEFIVCIQRDVPLAELERLAESLLRRIQEKFSSSSELSRMSASIGLRNDAPVNLGMDTLIRQADLAMYSAKARGKGCYCIWNPAMGGA